MTCICACVIVLDGLNVQKADCRIEFVLDPSRLEQDTCDVLGNVTTTPKGVTSMFWKCKTYGACTATDIMKGTVLGSTSASVLERHEQHAELIFHAPQTMPACFAMFKRPPIKQLTTFPLGKVHADFCLSAYAWPSSRAGLSVDAGTVFPACLR
jgi:hypothetical protein